MSRVIGDDALVLAQAKLAGLKPCKGEKGGETKVAGAL